MHNRNVQLVVAALVVFGAVAANSGAQDAASPAASEALQNGYTWLQISAFTDIPLARADVRVYDTAGHLLFERCSATNTQGVFPARVRALPRDFRVTVTWDASKQEDFDHIFLGKFKLSADERDFNPVHGVVYVNPVTTIVSRLIDRFPHLRLHEARALVRRALGFPPNASLGAALRQGKFFTPEYFSEKEFLKKANEYGGVKEYVEFLITEILKDPDKKLLFAAPPKNSLGGALSFVAENLAKGALSWAAGQGCGWALQSAGITTPGATVDDIANLQAGLTDLQSSVDQLSKQIDALTNQVLAQFTTTQYNQIVVPALQLASLVNGVEDDLAYFNSACPPGQYDPASVNVDFCTSRKGYIIGELSDVTISQSFGTLSTYVLDNPTLNYKGLVHLFSQSLGQTVRFFRPADSTKVQNMFDYWDAVQTQAANLKVELLHFQGAQNSPATSGQLTGFLGDPNVNPPTQGTFQNTRDAEQKLMFPAVPVGTVVDTKTRFMWRTDIPTDRNGCNARWPYSWSYAPYTDNTFANGLSGWSSPFFADFQTLVDGGGSDPMGWLIAQTKAVAPDTPQSAGFPDIVYAGTHFAENPGYWCIDSTAVWSVDPAPPINGSKAYYVFDFKTGTKRSSATNYPFWLFLRRPLGKDEQYYWYP